MVDFSKQSEVQAWLETRSREEIAVFAARAAARVFPVLVHESDWSKSNLDLICARAILTAGVRGVYATPAVMDAAAAAASNAAFAAANAIAFAADAAAFAANAAVSTAATAATAVNAAFAAASNVAFVAFAADAASFDVVTAEGVMGQALWQDGVPEGMAQSWQAMKDVRSVDHRIWGFWIDWYDGLLEGRSIDWDLWHDVALIPDDVWDEGPEAVARAIEDVKAALVAKRLPYSAALRVFEKTGRIAFEPVPPAKPDLMSATLDMARDALEDVLADPSNGLNEKSMDVRRLNRSFSRYANDPQRLEMDATTSFGNLTRLISVGELPPSDENLALLNALQELAQGIRATNADVAENREILKARAIAEMDDANVALLEDAVEVFDDILVPENAEEIREDILFLTQDMRAGPPPLPGVTRAVVPEEVRVFGRAAAISVYLRKVPAAIHRLDGTATVKAGKMTSMLAAVVALSWKLLF